MGLMRATSMPSSSAAIWASAIRVPLRSGLPETRTAVPSSLMLRMALDSPPLLNQKPEATPRPWFAPKGAE